MGPGATGACRAIGSATPGGDDSGLFLAKSVVVAPGSRHVYVVASLDGSIARFTFNRANGALNYNGCMTAEPASGPGGTGACAPLPTLAAAASGFDGPEEMTISRNGRDIYVSVEEDSAIARFRRSPNGTLTWGGCISGDVATGPGGSGPARWFLPLRPSARLSPRGAGQR